MTTPNTPQAVLASPSLRVTGASGRDYPQKTRKQKTKMSKKHFIALADAIRAYQETKYRNGEIETKEPFLLDVLADFCESQNPYFKRDRWLDYVAGKCGPNGGAIK